MTYLPTGSHFIGCGKASWNGSGASVAIGIL